ncbi:MAG: hypothetical protein R6U01_01780 [Halorubrum sp.]
MEEEGDGNGAEEGDGDGAEEGDGDGAEEGGGNGAEEGGGNGAEEGGGNGAEERDGDGAEERDASAEVSEGGEGTVRGFVAFDVRADTVHVTDFEGSGSTVRTLFEEPRRFARREGMGVEVVVPNDEETSEVIEASGFAAAGRGPRFEGRRTTRYRIESEELDEGKDE